MSTPLESSILRDFLAGRTLIFPTNQAAEFWQRKLLTLANVGALRRDRVISWNRFITEYLSESEEDTQPVTSAIRLIFLHSQLHEISLTDLFPRVLSESTSTEYPQESEQPLLKDQISIYSTRRELEQSSDATSIDTFVSILPKLPRYIRSLIQYGDTKTVGAWQRLEELYTLFLKRYNLVEPSWIPYQELSKAKASKIQGSFSLYFSESIDDFSSIHALLAKGSLDLRVINTESLISKEGRSYAVYQGAHGRSELWWMMSTIQSLLQKGVPPWEILITLPQYEAWKEEVEEVSDILGIPVTPMKGESLKTTSLGNLFTLLQRAEQRDFHIEDLENLFFCGSIRWKRITMLRSLIRDMRESGIVSLSFDGSSARAWEAPFRLRFKERNPHAESESVAEHVSLLHEFFTQVRELVRCSSLMVLSQRITDFCDTWLLMGDSAEDTDCFLTPLEDQSTFREEQQRISGGLQSLFDAIALTGESFRFSRGITPYRLFLKILAITQSKEPTQEGVALVPYGRSLGVAPLYHFIPGASQSALGRLVPDKTDTFLGLSHAREGDEISYAESIARMYTLCGGRVYFSSSHKSFQGEEILYLPLAADKEPLPSPQTPDIGEQEISLWWDPSLTKSTIQSTLLYHGVLYAMETGFSEKKVDLTTMPIESELLKQKIDRCIPHADGSYRLSASSIDAFNTCGFKYLFNRLIGLPGVVDTLEMRSARVEGTLLHRALELLLTEHIENQGTCYGELASLTAESPLIQKALEQATEESWGGRIPNYLRRELGLRGAVHIQRAVQFLASKFPEYRPLYLEKSFTQQVVVSSLNCTFRGTIDNLSIAGDALVLIDYKRSASSLSSIQSIHELGFEGSIQIPFYLKLLEAVPNLHVTDSLTSGGYYIFVDGSFKQVVGEKLRSISKLELPKSYFTDITQQIERSNQRIELVVPRMIEALQKGDFRVNAANPLEEIPEKHCEACSLRTLCRTRYVVE